MRGGDTSECAELLWEFPAKTKLSHSVRWTERGSAYRGATGPVNDPDLLRVVLRQTGEFGTGQTFIIVQRLEGGAAWRELNPGLHVDDEDVLDLLLEEGGGGDEGVQGGVGDDHYGGPGVLQLGPDHLGGEVWV